MDIGFSFFFILVALGSLAILARTVALNLNSILLAFRGDDAAYPVREFTVKVMNPMQHPRVTRRLHRRQQHARMPLDPRRQQRAGEVRSTA